MARFIRFACNQVHNNCWRVAKTYFCIRLIIRFAYAQKRQSHFNIFIFLHDSVSQSRHQCYLCAQFAYNSQTFKLVHVLWIRLWIIFCLKCQHNVRIYSYKVDEITSCVPFRSIHFLPFSLLFARTKYQTFSLRSAMREREHQSKEERRASTIQRPKMYVHVDGLKLYKIYLIWHSYGNMVTKQPPNKKLPAERVFAILPMQRAKEKTTNTHTHKIDPISFEKHA